MEILPEKYIIQARKWWYALPEQLQKNNFEDCKNATTPEHVIIATAVLMYNNDQRLGWPCCHFFYDKDLGLLYTHWGKHWEQEWVDPKTIYMFDPE